MKTRVQMLDYDAIRAQNSRPLGIKLPISNSPKKIIAGGSICRNNDLAEITTLGAISMLRRRKQQLACLVFAPLAICALVNQEVHGQVADKQTSDNQPEDKRAPIIRIASVKPPKQEAGSTVERYGLTRDDFSRIQKTIASIQQAVPLRTFVGEAGHGDQKIKARVTGTTKQLARLTRLKVTKGRFLSNADIARMNNVAVIDSTVAKRLFSFSRAIGKNIQVGTHNFLIVGVTKAPAESKELPAVYLPISTMRSRLGDVVVAKTDGASKSESFEISEILLSVKDPEHAANTLEIVKRLLAKFHEAQDYRIKLMND